MSATREFERLAAMADRVRPRDRAEFYRRLDDAAGEAMREAQARGGWSLAAEVYYDWIRIPRERGPSRLSELPSRVAAALAEATYRRIELESSQCPPN